jgi:phytoene dehydrogenase-like protein
MSPATHHDAVIVGGGLAGLTAAALLARAGRRVAVLEKSATPGGRARTTLDAGFHLNLGPHALYRSGAALRELQGLGITPTGATPAAAGGFSILGNRRFALPGGPVSLLTTGLLGLAGKLELARWLAGVAHLDAREFDRASVRSWLAATIHDPTARALLQALFRLTSYANAPDLQSAGANLQQLQAALADSVLYIDGGWQTVVDHLRRCAEDAGARLRSGTRVIAIETTAAGQVVHLADGEPLAAANVLLAIEPDTIRELLGATPMVDAWLGTLLPVHAACLDVALRRLPKPRATFALGIDRPLYFSVHSAAARLVPEAGGAVLHALLYQPADAPVAARDAELELEHLVDRMQPGWRNQIVTRRFLPKMTVTHGAPLAASGGISGRPSVAVPGYDGIFAAGDWVGAVGMLADASVASARAAADAILARGEQRTRAAA